MTKIIKIRIFPALDNKFLVCYFDESGCLSEELHAASEVYQRDNITVVQGRFFYQHEGVVYEMDVENTKKVILRCPFCAQCVWLLQSKDENAPFNYLLVNGIEEEAPFFEAEPIQSFEKWFGMIEAQALDGRTLRYSYKYEYDHHGHVQYSDLVKR